jgi:hypothetical protein
MWAGKPDIGGRHAAPIHPEVYTVLVRYIENDTDAKRKLIALI